MASRSRFFLNYLWSRPMRDFCTSLQLYTLVDLMVQLGISSQPWRFCGMYLKTLFSTRTTSGTAAPRGPLHSNSDDQCWAKILRWLFTKNIFPCDFAPTQPRHSPWYILRSGRFSASPQFFRFIKQREETTPSRRPAINFVRPLVHLHEILFPVYSIIFGIYSRALHVFSRRQAKRVFLSFHKNPFGLNFRHFERFVS